MFDADPSVVDLRRKAPLFYLLLFSLMNFGPSKAGQAAATAARVFQVIELSFFKNFILTIGCYVVIINNER